MKLPSKSTKEDVENPRQQDSLDIVRSGSSSIQINGSAIFCSGHHLDIGTVLLSDCDADEQVKRPLFCARGAAVLPTVQPGLAESTSALKPGADRLLSDGTLSLIEQVAARILPAEMFKLPPEPTKSPHGAKPTQTSRETTAARHPRVAPSHRRQNLVLLGNCARKLASLIEALDLRTRLLVHGLAIENLDVTEPNIEGNAPTTVPLLLYAWQESALTVALLRLVEIRCFELAGTPRETKMSSAQIRPAYATPSSSDVEERYRDIANRYLGQHEAWRQLAAIARVCGEDRVTARATLSPGEQATLIQRCAGTAEKMLHQLGRLDADDAEALMADAAGRLSEGTNEHELIRFDDFVRRFVLLDEMLQRLCGARCLPEAYPGYGPGRAFRSDPCHFAIEALCAAWLQHGTGPLEGRAAKAGTFSRFVEECLGEAMPVFPMSEIRTGLRWFHDYRNALVRRVRRRLSTQTATNPSPAAVCTAERHEIQDERSDQ